MPAEPEVVGIDYERQLPANKSIYVGESARFLLVFDPVGFICNENDFTISDDDVTVTMEEGADNVVRITLGEDITPGYVVAVYFREQLIMFVTAEERKSASSFDWEAESSFSELCTVTGFDLPEIDNTTEMVIKMRGSNFDSDLVFTWDDDDERLECSVDELPSEMTERPHIEVKNAKQFYIAGEDDASENYSLELISIVHAGVNIYP